MAEKKKYWWENEFLRVEEEKLFLGPRLASNIASEFGTPLFVISKNQILSNYRKLKQLFSSKTELELRICYAMKANPDQKILRILHQEGAWIDAVSPGEVEEAMRAGFPACRIIFTGTSLSSEDLSSVMAIEGITLNVDAEEQLELMREIKEKRFPGQNMRVSVRWNPGIGRGFNARAVTAGSTAPDGTPIKFGVEEERVVPLFEKIVEYGFRPQGLHQHLGSGWREEDFQAVKAAVEKIISKACEIEKNGFSLEFLDFGGGFGPRYSESEALFPLESYASLICGMISNSGLKIKALALEPGKYLVGNAGVLLVRAEYVKESYGNLFACVNAGTFNTLPRPAIYAEAHHHVVNCSDVGLEKAEEITVAGNLCETGDVFARKARMARPKRGDILAVLNAGAYCRSMASYYNLRQIPPEIVI